MGCWCSICSSRLVHFFYLHVWVHRLLAPDCAARLDELIETGVLWNWANSQNTQLTLNDLQSAYQWTFHTHWWMLSRRKTFLEVLKLVIDYKRANTAISLQNKWRGIRPVKFPIDNSLNSAHKATSYRSWTPTAGYPLLE
jgi:hypothetical protein